jgi:hypothetical protein
MPTPQRRIDDRIRVACARLLSASNKDFRAALREILRLISEKNHRLKTRAAKLLLKGEHLSEERRQYREPIESAPTDLDAKQ